MSAVGIVSPLRSHPVKLFHPEHEVDAVVLREGVAAVAAGLVLGGISRHCHHTIHGVTNVHAVDVHLHEVVGGVQGLAARNRQIEVGQSCRGDEPGALLREGDDVDGLVGALVQGDGLVGLALLVEGDGGVVNGVRHQAVVDLSGHAILHRVADVGVEGLHAGLQGAELGLDGLDVGVVGLDAVAHSLDVGTGHHVGAVLDVIIHQAVVDVVGNQGVDAVVDVGTAVLNLGLHTAVHVAAVLDLVGGEVVLNHRVDGVVGGGGTVSDGSVHTVGHITAVLDLVRSEVVLDHRVDRDVGGRGGILDGVVHAVHHVAAVHMGAEGVRNGIHRRTVGGDGHCARTRIVGDHRIDGSIRPDDVIPCSRDRGAAAHHQRKKTVWVGAEAGVGLAIAGNRAVKATDVNRHRHVALVVHQLVLCITHHRLVGQLLVEGHLRKAHRQSHEEHDGKE